MVLGQILGAVKSARRLLAAGERELQRAPWLVALGLEAHEQVDPDRGLSLVVRGAAGVEVTAFLNKGERVAGPVLPLGLDHVDVSQQEDRLCRRVSAGEDGHQAALFGLVLRDDEVEVALGYTCSFQTHSHALGGERAA